MVKPYLSAPSRPTFTLISGMDLAFLLPVENRALLINLKLSFVALLGVFAMPGFSAYFSIGEPNVAWSKKTLRICWASTRDQVKATQLVSDPDFPHGLVSLPTSEEKKIVRDLISREFTSARTGLSFSGWTNCKKTGETADVYIVAIREQHDALSRLVDYERPRPALPSGQASIGQSGEREEFTNDEGVSGSGYRKKNLKKKAYVFLRLSDYSQTALSLKSTLEMNALHEFGHLAGLRHEHLREEAKNDPHCALASTDLNTREHQSPLLTAKSFSQYDPQSIMNYCHLDLIEKITGLHYYESRSENPTVYPLGSGAILGDEQTQYRDPRIATIRNDDPNFREITLRIGLSAGDIHGLRCLYAYPPAMRKLRCTDSYDALMPTAAARN